MRMLISMNLKEFEKRVLVLDAVIAQQYRKKYIDAFVDTNTEFYKQNIENLKQFSDGKCYTGYLWDCLKNPTVIDWKIIESYASLFTKVLVFWDIHSCDRIFIPDYWKFPKDACIEMSYMDLLQNKEFLPEDIYIFDKTFSWTIIFTHETDLDNNSLFIQSGL